LFLILVVSVGTLVHRHFPSLTAIPLLPTSALVGANLCRTIKSTTMSKERHSEEATVEFLNMKVIIIPALADNFMYLVSKKHAEYSLKNKLYQTKRVEIDV